MKAVRSSRFLIPDRPQRQSAAQAAEAPGLLPVHFRRCTARGVVPVWRGDSCGYAAAKKVERGPGCLIGVSTPGPRCAAPGKGSVQALYACLPERCPVPREAGVGVDAGAGVPALQLRSLSVAGTGLPPLRSRERVLRRRLRQHPPRRVPQARPGAVSAQPSRCDAAR
jgi:hypothetical protein